MRMASFPRNINNPMETLAIDGKRVFFIVVAMKVCAGYDFQDRLLEQNEPLVWVSVLVVRT